MIKYEQINITANANSSSDGKILQGISTANRRVHMIGTAVQTNGVSLTMRNNETTLAEINSTQSMGNGFWFPIEMDLTPQDVIYLGLKNVTTANHTAYVGIAYEDLPKQGG